MIKRIAVGYVRCSTGKQQISLEAQELRIRAICVARDIELSEVIVDSDASAKSLERPGMNRLLGMVDDGLVHTVVIFKLDRISRDVVDWGTLIKRFNQSDVTLISVSDSIDTKSASGQLVLNVLMAASQWERMSIGERTSTALQHIKSQGFPAGPPPYGWSAQPRTSEEKDRKIRKPLILNPEEQDVIDLVRSWSGLPVRKIAVRLNDAGFHTRSGGPWHAEAVQRIVKSLRKVAA